MLLTSSKRGSTNVFAQKVKLLPFTLSSFLTIIRRILFATCIASTSILVLSISMLGATSLKAQTKNNPFAPTQIQAAYGITQLAAYDPGAARPTVAIVVSNGDIDSNGKDWIQYDLKHFDSQGHINHYSDPGNKNWTLHEVQFVKGTITHNQQDANETVTDVEWVHAIAPYAHILLVLTPSHNPSDLLTSVVDVVAQFQVHIVSMSWGWSEDSNDQTYDGSFLPWSAVYLAASGDDPGVVSYPSASPNVISVAATYLNLDHNNNIVSEYPNPLGYGASAYEPRPVNTPFQDDWVTSSLSFLPRASTQRYTPDVGATGDWVHVFQFGTDNNGTLAQQGNTSLATPIWAGLVALLDQKLPKPITGSQCAAALYFFGQSPYFRNFLGQSGPIFDQYGGIGAPNAAALIGAIQAAVKSKSIMVTNTNDFGPGSLRAAITFANTIPGMTIAFDKSVSGTIMLDSDLPTITSNVTIQGPGESALAIDGNTGPYVQFVLGVQSATKEPSVTISGLTIQNGGGNGITNYGTLNVSGCTIAKNTSQGIYNQPASSDVVTVANCTITGNGEAGIANYGPLKVTGGKIANNTAQGIFSQTALSDVVTIANCTIAGSGYGGVWNDSGNVTVTNCALTGNAGFGFTNSGNSTVTNCPDYNNTLGTFNNLGGVLMVVSPALQSLALVPSSVAGGGTVTGTITLNAPALVGGLTVLLSSNDSAAASCPVSVTVPAGASTANFVVNTNAVSTDTTVTITATLGVISAPTTYGCVTSAQMTVLGN